MDGFISTIKNYPVVLISTDYTNLHDSVLISKKEHWLDILRKEFPSIYITGRPHPSNFLSEKLMKEYLLTKPSDISLLIIDGISKEPSTNLLLILLLWKYLNKGHLLLISDEIPLRSTQNFLMNLFPDIFIYQTTISKSPIELRYTHKNYTVNDPSILYDTFKLAVDLHATTIQGDFLIYVPAPSDGKTIYKFLSNASLENATIIPAYDTLPDITHINVPENLQENSEIYKERVRKIIIATEDFANLIPSKNLSVVIDTLIEKRQESSLLGGIRSTLSHISKEKAESRSNRLGFRKSAIAYRMITLKSYNELESEAPLEIYRIPIHPILIELINSKFPPVQVLSPLISETRILDILNLMIDLGCLSEKGNQVTDAGNFVSKFPLSLRNATVLWRWYRQDLPVFPAISVLSMIDSYGPPYIWYPRKRLNQSSDEYKIELQETQRKYYDEFGGYSDIDTLCQIIIQVFNAIGGPQGNFSDLYTFCQQHNLHITKIQEALQIINQCVKICKSINIDSPPGPFNQDTVIQSLRPLLTEVYSDMVLRLRQSGSIITYQNLRGFEEYRLNFVDASNNFSAYPPNYIVALLTTQVIMTYPNGGGSSNLVINLALNLETPQIVQWLNKVRQLWSRNLPIEIPVVDALNYLEKQGIKREKTEVVKG